MEIMLLFAAGWLMSHAFGEKRDEYERSQDAHRERYMQRLARKHPNWSKARQARYLQNAARRNALGHFAYLLRHGWSSTFNDFSHGWDKAKEAHEEWKAEHPKGAKKPGFWKTFKAGWKNQEAQRPQPEKAEATPAAPTPVPAPAPAPEQSWREKHDLENQYQRYAELRGLSGAPLTAAQLVNEIEVDQDKAEELAQRWSDRFERENPAASSNAKVLQLTKTPGSTAGSMNRRTAVEFNYDRSKAEMNGISEYVTAKLSVLEQIIADAIAGDMNKDPETMSHLASLQEALSNANAHATAAASSMTKHASGQEYANTGHAASTDYLRSN